MKTVMADDERKAWLAIRKEAGRKIDPETARSIGYTLRRSIHTASTPICREECQQVGREYFARSPGGDVWVWFDDLSATRDALWEKYRSKPFPADLRWPCNDH